MLHFENKDIIRSVWVPLLIILFNCNVAAAAEYNISSYSKIGLSREPLQIDGVTSRFGIGGTGINMKFKPTQRFEFGASYLLAYYPNYTTIYRNTKLSGSMSGNTNEIDANVMLGVYENLKIHLVASFLDGKYGSDSLTGTRNGTILSSSSTLIAKQRELGIKMDYPISEWKKFSLDFGIQNWNVLAEGITFVDGDNDPIRKKIKAQNTDPYLGMSYVVKGNGIDWEFKYQLSRLTAEKVTYVDEVSMLINVNF